MQLQRETDRNGGLPRHNFYAFDPERIRYAGSVPTHLGFEPGWISLQPLCERAIDLDRNPRGDWPAVRAKYSRPQFALYCSKRLDRIACAARINPGMGPSYLVSRAVLDVADGTFLNTHHDRTL